MKRSPGVSFGNREAECVRRVLFGALQQRGGEHHDLVGDRQRREHAAAANDDARIGFLFDARGEKRIGLLCRAHGAIRLRRNQRVREAEIVLAQVFVVAHGVGAEARIGFGEERRAGRVSRHRAIDVVGHATHHAVRVVLPDLHRPTDAHELLVSLRHHERARDLVAAGGRVVQRDVRLLPLQVVQLRQCVDAALERRVRRVRP